ncbi:MAG: cell division protein FtsZ [Bacteroidota bacterium]
MTDFTTRFAFDDDAPADATIRVAGVGGGGGNAVNNMLAKGIHGVDFVAVNTDQQALQVNLAPLKLQVGRERTAGLGAGARPSVGAEAAQESHKEIEAALQGCDMVFVTAGMGGGTGTGAAPVISAIAKEMGILTVAVVTKPFVCEGKKRLYMAEQGIEQLRETVDTLVIVPNERLLDIADEDTSLVDAFVMADDVLYNAVRGISELITVHGLINLDFADVRTTMLDGGTALMGSSIATGEKRAERAAKEALESPLLDGISIYGARNVLVNITAGPSLSIREATRGMSVIQEQAGDDAEVIFGTVIDPEMGDQLRVTVMATGFDANPKSEPEDTIHRTVPLQPSGPLGSPHYKGEMNLKDLDKPAFERRSRVAPPAEKVREVEETADDAPLANVRRLRSSELPAEPGQRIRKGDPDVPAFLRRMMD